MIMIYSRDQILEYLMHGWSLSKKQIKGHLYGYLQKYREPPIYLGKWTSVHTDLKQLQTENPIENPNTEKYSLEVTENLPVELPLESIQVKPSSLPTAQKDLLLEKVNTTAEINLSAMNVIPPNYSLLLSEDPPKSSAPSFRPIKDEIREPLQKPSPITSVPSNDGPIQNQDHNAPSAREAVPSENLDPSIIALLLAVPVVSGVGFVVHNWEAINNWGKNQWNEFTTWWNGLFSH